MSRSGYSDDYCVESRIYGAEETPEQRWLRMRHWVGHQIKEAP